MKRRLLIAAVFVCVFAASGLQSRAAITIGEWQTTPVQVVGGATWTLLDTTLPDNLSADFFSFSDLRFENTSGYLFPENTYSLHYNVQLTDGTVFDTVFLDSTRVSGVTSVTKEIRASDGGPLLVSVSSLNGDPSAVAPIPGGLSMLDVQEEINLYLPNGIIGSFNNTYTVTVVPEPTTIIAGALLLLPFGLSTLRVLRKRRAA